MAGLVPAIHVFAFKKDVDHDGQTYTIAGNDDFITRGYDPAPSGLLSPGGGGKS
jgi:hypothetical protein